jgi:type II secretory pathway pseudopilin PulG
VAWKVYVPQRSLQRHSSREAGFSLVESTIALGLVMIVLVGLLATVSTSVRGIVSSRQRGRAVALANEAMEVARGLSYNEVGHDLDNDASLVTDTRLTAAGTNAYTFRPCGSCTAEALVGSSIDWHTDASHDWNTVTGSGPFHPHLQTWVEDGTTYTTAMYVSRVVPLVGAPHKRLTAIVTWTSGQYASTAKAEVRLESLMFEVLEPPDPLLQGTSDIDGGVVTLTGDLQNLELQDGFLWLPYTHGEIDSRFIRRVSGYASGGRSQLNLNRSMTTDEIAGCTVVNSAKTAECRGVKATTVADNDQGTAPGPHDFDTVNGAAGTIERKNVLAIAMGASSATSRSTAAACGAPCAAPYDTYSFSESDGLPFHDSEATGATSVSMTFACGALDGSLVSFASPAQARSTLDRDDTGAGATITTFGSVSHPAIRVLPLNETVYDITGLTVLPVDGFARVGTTSATVTTAAGPGVAGPAYTASDVTVELYDTTGLLPEYQTHTFTPGVAASASAHAEVLAAGLTVIVDVTVSTSKAVVKSTATGSTYDRAEVSLTNWLDVTTRLQVRSGGSTIGDITVGVDYGRLHASSLYQAGPA